MQSRPIEGARIARALLWFLLMAVSRTWAAPEFDFRPPPTAVDPSAGIIMRDLAARLIPVYQDTDPERYLANLSALQMAAGDYTAADISRRALRERRRKLDFVHPDSVIFDMYAHAKALEAENKITFAEAFTTTFRETIPRLDDHAAYEVSRWLAISPAVFREALQKSFDQMRAKDSVDQAEAVELIWRFVYFDAYRTFGSLSILLATEDDHRRYTVDNDVLIKTRDGATLTATVIRPNNLTNPLPTLLEFTIYDSQNFAKECAAHGYVGVVAYTRGKRKSSGAVVPFQRDGEDARAVINWIAKQPWSDGRVGMYGEGYSGFTAWAAAKRLPPALKAIATSASSAPGINIPMAGNIHHNSAYGWSLRVAGSESDENSDDDPAQWRALDQKWYRSGERYRDLGRLFGKPNPIFIRWLNHPSYDRFWQQMVPYHEQFAHINIPVLTMTGYYAASEPGDLYYFTQHHRYNPHADHTLIIGPYDDAMMSRGQSVSLHGLQVDSAALVDFRVLRYQWFDHVFKGTAAPSLLKESVNYEVTGANEWQHASSLEAMAVKSLKFYLDAAASGANHRLTTEHKKTNDTFVQQTVDFVDRTDAAWTPSTDLISRSLAPRHGTIYASEPLAKSTMFNGLFSGRLDFTVNKMDMDLNITLYELLANGDYVRLFSPTYELRASYARDRAHRHLLKAGERQELVFKSERMTSRLLQTGSRLVMVLGISKRPDREINYGTGGDVSEESVADGKVPLKLKWYSDSYIEIPLGR